MKINAGAKSVWYIVGGLLLIGLSSLAISCGMIEPPSPPPPTATIVVPQIPHSTEGRDDCRACHAQGIGGAPQFPVETHSERPSDVCHACHQPAVAGEEDNKLSKTPLLDRTAFPYFDTEEGSISETTPAQPEGTMEETTAVTPPATEETPQATIAAEEIYTARCAACHGVNREGVAGFAPALTPDSLAELSDAGTREAIAKGVPGTAMPGFEGTLSPEEIDALLQFIKNTTP
ncbi:MAG: c-type cytochrome [Dehalococcoidales bacterium]|nr:c-type cytochrome [Dehalococcoidales bacterium]